MMKKLIIATLLTLILGLSNIVNAAQVYYYTSNTLIPQNDSTPSSGRLTATVTLSSSLPSDFTGGINAFTPVGITDITLSAFGMTLTGTNSHPTEGAGITFQNGIPTAWVFGLWFYNSQSQATVLSSNGDNPGYDNGFGWIPARSPHDEATNVYINGEELTGISNIPGIWSTTPSSPVPIPGAIFLFGSGLVGLIGIRRRAKS
jgi:hypothetical protein